MDKQLPVAPSIVLRALPFLSEQSFAKFLPITSGRPPKIIGEGKSDLL